MGLLFDTTIQIVHLMENNILFMEFKTFYMTNKKILVEFKKISRAAFIGILILFGQTQLGFAQTTSSRIHPDDTINSQDFKNNQGGNRYVIFKKLENLIKPASAFEGPAPAYDYFIGDYKISGEDLIQLLGEPDTKIAPTVWIYYLNIDQTCQLIIGIDSEGMVSYLANKGC